MEKQKEVVLYLLDEMGQMVFVSLKELAPNATEVYYSFRHDVVKMQVAGLLRRLANDVEGTKYLDRAHWLADEEVRKETKRALRK